MSTPLFQNRNFFLIWLASILGNLALAVAMLAETWYVVNTLNAKAQLGLVMIAGSVPRIALMAFGGVLADRMKRGRIIATSLSLRVLLLLALVALLHFNLLDIWAIAAFALIYGVLDAFFWPARDAILPSLVRDQDLTRANSIMLTTNQVGMVFGPVLGGLLLAKFSFGMVFTLTAAMLALATMATLFIREPDLAPRDSKSHVLAELKEGLMYALQTPVLRALMIIYAIANLLFMGPLGIGIPIIVTEQLGGEATTLSYLQSAFAAGMVLSGTLLTIFPPARKRLMMIVIVIALEGLALAGLGFSHWVWLAIALQFAIGIGVAANNVPMMSLIQQHTDRSKIGRVMSLNTTASMGLTPLSYAMVTGLISLGASTPAIMASFGVGLAILVIALAVYLPVIRRTD
ncbi:MFS transporter [Chitinibacteraceae bacterium HSL-7]